MRKWAFLLVFLGGCSSMSQGVAETIYLRNAAGETVKCGPYLPSPFENQVGMLRTELKLRACVEDFQKAGYQRIATP